MTEWASRLIALKDALIAIFPPELLSMINCYIKAKMHEWEILEPPDSMFATVSRTRAQLTSFRTSFLESFSVVSKYWIEDGPCSWSLRCDKLPPISFWWSDQIEVGVFMLDIFGGMKQTPLAYINETLVIIPTIPCRLANDQSPQLVIRVDPICRAITTSDANNREASVTVSYPNLVSCRPYVRLSQTTSVELMPV